MAASGYPTLNGVTIDGLFQVYNTVDPVLVGTITNMGNTIEQNSIGGATHMKISGDVVVTGPGTWKMSNHVRNRIFGLVPAATLTNDTNHTIQGAGEFRAMAQLMNKGTIDANQVATLTIDSTAPVANTGTLKASSGGTLVLDTLGATVPTC